MSVSEAFVIDVLNIVNEELIEAEMAVTPQSQIYIINNWIEDYEDVTDLNRIEKRLMNALHAAGDHLHRQIKSLPKTA